MNATHLLYLKYLSEQKLNRDGFNYYMSINPDMRSEIIESIIDDIKELIQTPFAHIDEAMCACTSCTVEQFEVAVKDQEIGWKIATMYSSISDDYDTEDTYINIIKKCLMELYSSVDHIECNEYNLKNPVITCECYGCRLSYIILAILLCKIDGIRVYNDLSDQYFKPKLEKLAKLNEKTYKIECEIQAMINMQKNKDMYGCDNKWL
jgi:hypothetical protein